MFFVHFQLFLESSAHLLKVFKTLRLFAGKALQFFLYAQNRSLCPKQVWAYPKQVRAYQKQVWAYQKQVWAYPNRYGRAYPKQVWRWPKRRYLGQSNSISLFVSADRDGDMFFDAQLSSRSEFLKARGTVWTLVAMVVAYGEFKLCH